MVTLDVSSETVCRLIELAREFHAQEGVVIPDEPGRPADDWPTQILASHAGDLTLEEFRSIVADLDPDQQQQVVALLWLGRGDFSFDEWQEALDQAGDEWTPDTADYLIAHPVLAEYLSEGLELHGLSCD
jgi:hypothetical protein